MLDFLAGITRQCYRREFGPLELALMKHARNHDKSQSAVGPTKEFLRHGYEVEEGPHAPLDADLLDREGHHGTAIPCKRIRSGVRRLLQDGKISGADAAAAERWSADYGLGVHGASDPQRRGSSCRGDVHGFRLAVIDSMTRYREACQAVGKHGDWLLRMFVFEGRSMSAMARMLAASQVAAAPAGAPKMAVAEREGAVQRKAQPYTGRLQGELVAALVALTEFYDAKSKDRKAGPAWAPKNAESGRPVRKAAVSDVPPEGRLAAALVPVRITQGMEPGR